MADENPLGSRGRSFEDDYFRKKDRELLEKMRQASAAEVARQELSATSGLQDPQMLQELQALGFRYDPAQVAAVERKSGLFKGVAEYVFKR